MTDSSAPAPPEAEPLTEDAFREAQLAQLNKIRRILIFLSLVAGAIACFFAKDVLLPIILGVMLALTLSPIVRGASRIGLPAPVSAVLLVVAFGIAILAAGYAASGPVGTWLSEVPELGAQVREKLAGLNESVERVKEASEEVGNLAEQGESGQVERVAIEQPGILNTAVSGAASAGTTLAVTLVLALFLLASGDMFRVKIVESMPRFGDKKRALRIMMGVERAISRYLLTITVINAGLGIVVGLLMTLAGLPKAYIWGLIAFVFNFLPFIGAVAGVILVSLYSVLTFDAIGSAVIPPLLYLAATSLEGQIITPAILGRRLELNTVSVFVTVVFWGWLWGIAGALMAVPFLVIVKVVCDNVPAMAMLGHFLGSSDMKVVVDEPADVAKTSAA